MATIQASKSKVMFDVFIDDEDLEKLGNRKISIGSHGYAQIWDIPLKRVFLLHRYILGIKDYTGHQFICDHIDKNKLNNKKENLRIVSPTQSNLNRNIKNRQLPTNIYLERGRYYVSIQRHNKQNKLGSYKTLEEAVKIRNSWLDTHKENF